MAVPYLPMPTTVFLKNWQTQPLFWLFSLFSNTKFTENKFKLQQDSNSDHRNRRRARWPLDHHHGPLPVTVRSYFYTFIFVETNWMEEEEGKLPRMIALTFEFFLFSSCFFYFQLKRNIRGGGGHLIHSIPGKGEQWVPSDCFALTLSLMQQHSDSWFLDHFSHRRIIISWEKYGFAELSQNAFK